MIKASLLLTVSTLLLIIGCKKNDNSPALPPVVTITATGPVQLPVDTAILSGSATPKGNATIKGYAWKEISGPGGQALIEQPTSASTPVEGLTEGTYIFQLTATDNKALTGVGYDTIQVLAASIQTLVINSSNLEYGLDLLGYTTGADAGTTTNSDEVWAAYSPAEGGFNPWVERGALYFNLGSIPANSTIVSAILSLYSSTVPRTDGFVYANTGAGDSIVLQQITAPLPQTSYSWSNQPPITTANQVLIPATNQGTLDLNIDVTAMVSTTTSNPNNFWGFMIRLQNENQGATTCRRFYSDGSTAAATFPTLTIKYQP